MRAPNGTDADIVAARTRLKEAWALTLTDDDRDAWRTLWETTPPADIHGRQFVTITPTTWNQTQLPEPDVFAWQQCYGFLYLEREIQTTPQTEVDAVLTTASLSATMSAIVLTLADRGDVTDTADLLVYATTPYAPGRLAAHWLLRPILGMQFDSASGDYDLTDYYAARFTPTEGLAILTRTLQIGANNSLLDTHADATAEVTA